MLKMCCLHLHLLKESLKTGDRNHNLSFKNITVATLLIYEHECTFRIYVIPMLGGKIGETGKYQSMLPSAKLAFQSLYYLHHPKCSHDIFEEQKVPSGSPSTSVCSILGFAIRSFSHLKCKLYTVNI